MCGVCAAVLDKLNYGRSRYEGPVDCAQVQLRNESVGQRNGQGEEEKVVVVVVVVDGM